MIMLRRPMTFAWAIVMGLAFALPLHAEDTPAKFENKSCPMQKRLASIDVRISRNGQVLVPVSMGGHDVWMVLNLQNGLMALFGSATADWHLETIRMANGGRRISYNGKTVTAMVREDFQLGGQGFQQWPFILVPAGDIPTFSYEGKPVVGELAARFLSAVDVELNLSQRNIALFDHVKCGTDAVYWGAPSIVVPFEFDETGLPHFPMELENQEIQSSFDTSSGASRIVSDVTKKYYGFDESSPGMQHDLLPSGEDSPSYRAMNLTAKALEIKDAKIVLRPMKDCHPDRAVGGRDGIGCRDVFGVTPFAIGTDLLRDLRVYIATQEKKIYFTRVAQPSTAASVTPTH